MTAPLLEARNLVKDFAVGGRRLRALDEVSLALAPGETLALVGESGCGKSTLARAVALLDPPTGGSLLFEGKEVAGLSRADLKPFRKGVRMVFQDPQGSLNPRLTVGASIAEPLAIHGLGDAAARREGVARLLEAVGLRPDDATRYPHEFSGGQRQRVAIARAIAGEPRLIVADEPVSALDVSVRSQVLNLLLDLQTEHGLAYLFIGHDLGVVRHMANRVAVMYLGRIVEEAPAGALFGRPSHPYTRALLAAEPRVGRGRRRPGKAPKGEPPSPLAPPSGCPFHPRCPQADTRCHHDRPVLEQVGEMAAHRAACHFRDALPPVDPWDEVRP